MFSVQTTHLGDQQALPTPINSFRQDITNCWMLQFRVFVVCKELGNKFKYVKGSCACGICVRCRSHDLSSHWHTFKIPIKYKFLHIWNFFPVRWTAALTLYKRTHSPLTKLSADPNSRPFCPVTFKSCRVPLGSGKCWDKASHLASCVRGKEPWDSVR